ncbi:hypothetical protein CERZMDRAFT_81303 [Cercospora zeae-maydis SCOH1-5]|uniref:Uncharacterized protein n=1 Tax=Cercospora zeae-maydis SCOH1-5 TaxID=717836 RepID=A0A6A6FRU5_9PEZI|nr:hypothetical protein CERZMDRAFT_81303 [Cercospora zeae-maydis SCOH1-5]
MDEEAVAAGAERARLAGMGANPLRPTAHTAVTQAPLVCERTGSSGQHSGPGEWAFGTFASYLAAARFGNNAGFGTWGVHQPSAQQIWNIRQMYKAAIAREGSEIREDATADIDLIWRPTTRSTLAPKPAPMIGEPSPAVTAQGTHKTNKRSRAVAFGTVETISIPAVPGTRKLKRRRRNEPMNSEVNVGGGVDCPIDLTLGPMKRRATAQSAEATCRPTYGPENPEADLGAGVDSRTGLAHEPTNYGLMDQSAEATYTDGQEVKKKYQTQLFVNPFSKVATKVTLDRAPAQVGVPEPHKFWYYDSLRWVCWPKWYEQAWDDGDWVESLNKYRDQSTRRDGWHAKRGTEAFQYTTEQLDWVWNLVKEAEGKMPERGASSIAKEFNETFELAGTDAARSVERMRKLVVTLCGDYEKSGGASRKMRPYEKGARKNKGKGRGRKKGVNAEELDNVEMATTQNQTALEEDAVAGLLCLGRSDDDEVHGEMQQ